MNEMFFQTSAKRMQLTLPFCPRRPVCDQYSPMIHTLTVWAHANSICNSQSAHQQTEVITQ